MSVVLFLHLGLMSNIDFAEKSDVVPHLNAYTTQIPGEISVAEGEANVRPVVISILVHFFPAYYCIII